MAGTHSLPLPMGSNPESTSRARVSPFQPNECDARRGNDTRQSDDEQSKRRPEALNTLEGLKSAKRKNRRGRNV